MTDEEWNQKEINDQMYLVAKQWLDDIPFERIKETPFMAISYCLARLSEQDELLKGKQEAMRVLSQRECETLPNHYERKGFCPKCHQVVEWFLNRSYCGFCGQEVKWDV